jgi:ribosome-associated heat shock protein Hsp15
MSEKRPALRLDKWLWHARFFKTRALSAEMIIAGKIRVNTARVRKPASPVRIGDGLTIVQGAEVRTVRVTGLGERRGPAIEARELYVDLTEDLSGKGPGDGSA